MKKSTMTLAAGLIALELVAIPALPASAAYASLGAEGCNPSAPNFLVAPSAKTTGTTTFVAYVTPTHNQTGVRRGSTTLIYKSFTTTFTVVSWSTASAATISETRYVCNRA